MLDHLTTEAFRVPAPLIFASQKHTKLSTTRQIPLSDVREFDDVTSRYDGGPTIYHFHGLWIFLEGSLFEAVLLVYADRHVR